MRMFDTRELEQYSGIKAHTIRIWEQRYGVLKASRTSTNRRLYSMNDLQLLLQLSVLTRYGSSISSLAALQSAQLQSLINRLSTTAARTEIRLNQLLVNFFSGDVEAFEQTLDHSVHHQGWHYMIVELICPFLEKTNLLSYSDQRSITHFAVTIIRRKLLAATELLHLGGRDRATILMFLPPAQHFDLILLYQAYILQHRGFRTLYLGTNVPVETIAQVIEKYSPEAVLTYMAPGDKTNLEPYMKKGADYISKGRFIVSTPMKEPEDLRLPFIHYAQTINHLDIIFPQNQSTPGR